jgi:hypothetical protein
MTELQLRADGFPSLLNKKQLFEKQTMRLCLHSVSDQNNSLMANVKFLSEKIY